MTFPLRAKALRQRSLTPAVAGALASALFGLSLDASASVMVQHQNFDLFGASYPLYGEGTTATGENTFLSYQRWDPAMGTLTAARWVLSSWLIAGGVGFVSSTSTDPNQVVEGSVEMRLRAGATHLVGTGSPASHMTLDHTFGFACSTSVATGQCVIDLDFSEALNRQLEATDLSAFVGSGNFNQGVELAGYLNNTARSPFVDISSIGAFHLFGGLGTSTGARLDLVYEYEAPGASVPEPASALLAGLGLALLATISCRNKSGGGVA